MRSETGTDTGRKQRARGGGALPRATKPARDSALQEELGEVCCENTRPRCSAVLCRKSLLSLLPCAALVKGQPLSAEQTASRPRRYALQRTAGTPRPHPAFAGVAHLCAQRGSVDRWCRNFCRRLKEDLTSSSFRSSGGGIAAQGVPPALSTCRAACAFSSSCDLFSA
jgi:hypothetical protein